MSSVVKRGWESKLRSGKTFSPIQVSAVNFKVLVVAAVEREDETWETLDARGGEHEEEMKHNEVDGVRHTGDWIPQHCPTTTGSLPSLIFASSSKVKVEETPDLESASQNIPEAPTLKKRPSSAQQDGSTLQQSAANGRRAKRRRRNFESHEVRVQANPQHHAAPVTTTLDPHSLPSKSDACTAKKLRVSEEFQGSTHAYTVEGLKEKGFRLIEWDGISSVPILDMEGRVVAVLAGRPDDDSYVEDALKFHDNILQKRMLFVGIDESQQRGMFPAQAVGISYGTGQPYPMEVTNAKYGTTVKSLLGGAERIAHYQSSTYCRWSPDNHHRYKEAREFMEHHEKTRNLRWNFERSVFAAATVNFGPQTRTYKHRDIQNSPFGWCAVTALGHFDPTQGGHLVLWDLGLAIEFPPGSTILLPSATIAHSNVSVREGETRTSFTQYSAGCIFRWVESGGRRLEELRSQDHAGWERNREAKRTGRAIETAIQRFATLESLIARGLVKP